MQALNWQLFFNMYVKNSDVLVLQKKQHQIILVWDFVANICQTSH